MNFFSKKTEKYFGVLKLLSIFAIVKQEEAELV